MGWLGRSLGQFGADVGTGHDIALDWKQREQDMAMKAAQQKLHEMMLPLQLQEIQARLAEMTQPKPAGLVGTRGGGTAGATFQPGKGYSLQPLEPGADPAEAKKQIQKIAEGAPKEFKSAILAAGDSIDAGEDPMKALQKAEQLAGVGAAKEMPTGTTINRLQQEALDAAGRGDLQGYQEKLNQINQLSKAAKPQAPTQWGLRVKAITDQGPEGDVARAALKAQEDEQIRLVKARGLAFGQGRLYQMHTYIMPDGTSTDMTGFEYLAARDRGEKLTPTGRLSPNVIVGYQRLQSEGAPALEGVRANLAAFDNVSDRAIFARVLGSAGQPEYGNESAWMRNVLDQVATGQLSPEGQRLKANLARLADTMGLVRASMALPSTDSAMQLTMSLLPGKSTPNAQYAAMQLENLRGIIVQSANIPIFSNMPNPLGAPAAPNTPPPGSKIISLNDFLKGP